MAPGRRSRPPSGGDDDAQDPFDAPAEVGDVLDLHTFLPRDAAALVADYLDESVRRGYRQVRIIHGKGIGVLRRIVHAVLDRHPAVERYSLANDGGGWGATVVRLKGRRGDAAPER